MKTIRKKSNSRIKVIWLIKVLVSVLLVRCDPAVIFAENNIVDNLQAIQHDQAQHSDNKLFQDLIQIDEQLLDIAETSLLIAKEGYSEIKIRDYVECIDWYARMIKARIMESDEPETIVNTINEFLFDELGFTYVQTGSLEDLYLNKAILLNSRNPGTYCNRGVIFEKKGMISEAIENYSLASLSDAYFARAIFFADTKKPEEAIEDFGKCISLSPNKTFAYYLRAKMYKEVDEAEKAILDLNKAITIMPSYAGLYTERGILLLQTDRIDKAITDFDKSLELFPLNPVAFRFRGESFKEKGQFEKAIEDFRMFLEIVPDAPVADIIRNEIQEMK